MAKIYELNFELLPRVSYSPDLATSDCFLEKNGWVVFETFLKNKNVIKRTFSMTLFIPFLITKIKVIKTNLKSNYTIVNSH